MFTRGDIVNVTDWSGVHPAHYNWFIEHRKKIEVGWLIRYAYGMDVKATAIPDQDFEVLYVDEEDGTALIELVCAGTHPLVFLVDVKALKKRKAKLTIEELKELVGFDFELKES